MAIKIKIPRSEGKGGKQGQRLSRDPVVRAAFAIFLMAALVLAVSFSYLYIKYDRIISARFRSPVFGRYRWLRQAPGRRSAPSKKPWHRLVIPGFLSRIPTGNSLDTCTSRTC